MTSPCEGQLTTDKEEMKFGHMLIIPFPVLAGFKYLNN